LSTLCEHPAPLVLIVSQQDTLHTHKSGRVKNTSKGFSPARLSLLVAIDVPIWTYVIHSNFIRRSGDGLSCARASQPRRRATSDLSSPAHLPNNEITYPRAYGGGPPSNSPPPLEHTRGTHVARTNIPGLPPPARTAQIGPNRGPRGGPAGNVRPLPLDSSPSHRSCMGSPTVRLHTTGDRSRGRRSR